MKRLLLLVVVCIAIFIGGCGLVDNVSERERRYAKITDIHARQMIDDWDFFWFADQPLHLTKWHLAD